MYNNLLRDDIFKNMLVSANFDESIDRDSLLSEMDDIIEDTDKGYLNSNQGGFHSKGYTRSVDPTGKPTLDKLSDLALQFVYNELNFLKWKYNEMQCYYWFMRNELHNYNNIHQHGRSDIIGVYYAKVPENSGGMAIMRTDGISYSSLFSRNSQTSCSIKPEAGRFYMMPGHLWHYVNASESPEARYSVAFNFYETVY